MPAGGAFSKKTQRSPAEEAVKAKGPSLDFFGVTGVAGDDSPGDDSYLLGGGADANVFAVADGLERRGAGKLTSSIAMDTLQGLESAASLEEGIQRANRGIRGAYRVGRRLGMASTVVAVRFVEAADKLIAEVAHVGDSRAYLLRGLWLVPLTGDHSRTAVFVKSGAISPAQASDHPQRNVITRSLGTDEEARVDGGTFSVLPEDRVLLCSGGLTEAIPETEVCRILRETPRNVEAAAEKLVAAALVADAAGSVTAVLVDVGGMRPKRNRAPETGADATVSRLDTLPFSLPGPQTASARSHRRGRTA